MDATAVELVAIADLTSHPDNPRRGDVAAIADSLAAHGQYRPVVVSRRTGHILAGNHTVKAAKRLRWRKIAAVFVDVDEAGERRILLADNRTADLGTYDDGALADLLRSIGDFDGTGYVQSDLDRLEGLFDAPTAPGGGDGITPTESEPDEMAPAAIAVGTLRLTVDRYAFEAWADPIERDVRKPVDVLRDRLGFPEPRPKQTDPETAPVRLSTVTAEAVPIDSLTLYPGNARQGDVGAISESLRVNGQYRPIVVNRRTSTILVGNHTWVAARALGWDRIAVTFVDVDETEAARIVLADNRTADLAGYDVETLTALLRDLSSFDGTGYTGDDLDELLDGANPRPVKPVGGPVRVRVDRFRFTVPRDTFDEWTNYLSVDDPWTDVATRLELAPGTWSAT